MAKKDYVHWTDSLFVPSSLVISFLLNRWLTRPLAMVLSFVAVTLVLALFEPREGGIKRFLFAMLAGALVTCVLALLHWPT
jgi:hypothetical protein